jgi:hypothetical protein
MNAPSSRLRLLKWAVALGFILFVTIQFVRPALQNPPVTADLQVPPEVKQILKNSCYNCHSNETHLSWFDWPAPAYWLVIRDVREGRKRLNFSEIGALPVPQQRGFLYESISQIELGAMPLSAYTLAHPGSAITAEQLAILKNYLRPATLAIASPEQVQAADAQYEKWISSRGELASSVSPAPNGIPFIPDYKNWQAISSTDRADNGTIRQILGNDIAIRAIAQNRINPWPEGSAFAKVAWLQQKDPQGTIRPGSFYQVEFMIRDSRKFAATLGWGWARWRGAYLIPYGKSADFTDECVACHRPLQRSNYVFTAPIRGQQ